MKHLRFAATSSPIGKIYLSATEKGLCLMALNSTEKAFIALCQKSFGAEPIKDPGHPILRQAEKELALYFQGKLKVFTVPIDWTQFTPFQKKVLQEALKIPGGSVASYGTLARRIGNPNASRAVGNALGANPIPILIPCHRVLPSSGKLGGYTGGPQIKEKLLLLEGVTL